MGKLMNEVYFKTSTDSSMVMFRPGWLSIGEEDVLSRRIPSFHPIPSPTSRRGGTIPSAPSQRAVSGPPSRSQSARDSPAPLPAPLPDADANKHDTSLQNCRNTSFHHNYHRQISPMALVLANCTRNPPLPTLRPPLRNRSPCALPNCVISPRNTTSVRCVLVNDIN